MTEMASWHRLPACGSAVCTFRGQRWLSEGVDKVAERDAAGARTLKIVGQASLPVVAARASWLAPHLRAVTVLAMPTSSAQLPLFIRTLRPKALALIAQRFVIGTHNRAPEAGALTKDPLWGAAAAPFSPDRGRKLKQNVESRVKGWKPVLHRLPACEIFLPKVLEKTMTGSKACPTIRKYIFSATTFTGRASTNQSIGRICRNLSILPLSGKTKERVEAVKILFQIAC